MGPQVIIKALVVAKSRVVSLAMLDSLGVTTAEEHPALVSATAVAARQAPKLAVGPAMEPALPDLYLSSLVVAPVLEKLINIFAYLWLGLFSVGNLKGLLWVARLTFR